MIHITTIEKDNRNSKLINALLDVWQASVHASHHFLTEADIRTLTPQAEEALLQIETLWIVEDDLRPVGFIHPDYFRKGVGKELVQRAFRKLAVEYVDVNEQNPDATRFYERMGFHTFRRDDTDDQGNPFPILRMKRLPLDKV